MKIKAGSRDGEGEQRGDFLIFDALGAFHSQTGGLVRSPAHWACGLEFHPTQLSCVCNLPNCSSDSGS